MRILTVILTSALVGTALGAAVALVQFRAADNIVLPRANSTSAIPVASNEPAPHAEVAETEYNFGTMQRGTKKSHQFVVKNTGAAPLTVQVGHTTCKCTLGVASNEPIAPGQSIEVHLEWTANASPGEFRQSATLLTNDPRQSQISLTIVGEVNEAKGVEPPDLLFDKVNAGESKTAQVFVMSMFEDTISVDNPEFYDPQTRSFLDAKIEPVDRDALPNPDAKAGVRITVTVKPGMPIGNFSQRLKLHTTLPEAHELNIPIYGRVVGDISVHGIDWDDSRSVLRLGSVKSSQGKRAVLNAVVRGPQAGDVKLNVISCDPPELKVKIGEAKRLKDDLYHVPLEIEVPAGTPPMVRLGTDQGDDGRIVLGTTGSAVHELVLGVRFSVER